MTILAKLDWHTVRKHYKHRVATHRKLVELHSKQDLRAFADLALGLSDPAGNYSAAEHGLGHKVLALNTRSYARLHALADSFQRLSDGRDVPPLIRTASLRFLAIGVGSELSCMVNPKVCWVANTRTIWTHLVIKHGDDIDKANEELRLYRDDKTSSEMAYSIWTAIHRELDVALTRIAKLGSNEAQAAGVKPGRSKYLWADAIASLLYSMHHD